jgi:integration host factor subunit alpha
VEVPILPRRVMVFKPSNVLKSRINAENASRRDAG